MLRKTWPCQKRGVPLLVSFLFLGSCHDGDTSKMAKDQEAWDNNNDPSWFGAPVRVFDTLPRSGRMAYTPWSDHYWPGKNGGIAWRWNGGSGANAWEYRLHSRSDLEDMSPDEIARLSPSEKYDIFRGRYDYPLTQSERRRTSPDNPGWWGMCDGVAGAALVHREPRPITVRNPDGIEVPFGSSDLKALLILAHSTQPSSVSAFSYLGVRCNANLTSEPGVAETAACRDMNAGTFHLALTNEIGLRRQGFVLDRIRDEEVWNYAAFAFDSRVVGERQPDAGSAPGTAREVLVETTVSMGAGSAPRWNPLMGRVGVQRDTFRYSVELDGMGQIVGGDWLDFRRPDFAWRPNDLNPSSYLVGEFADLRRLVDLTPVAPPRVTTTPTPRPTVVPTWPTPRPTAVPTPRPTPRPTPVVEVTPRPSTVTTREESLRFGPQGAGFSMSVRSARTYRASEWITLSGKVDRPLVMKTIEVFTQEGTVAARGYANITTGVFNLRFRLPPGSYNLAVQAVATSGSVMAQGNVNVKVLHH